MCGRATLTTGADDLREFFGLEETPELPPRYNIAPTQPIAVIREPRRLEFLRWGLSLSGGQRHGAQGINVRVETVARAPAYRDSFRRRRCLVVVDGFYEWRKAEKARQPFLVRQGDKRPFALAGIWDRAVTSDGEVVDACAIVTGDARGVVAELHDRMPLVVPRESYDLWLSTDAKAGELLELIAPRETGFVSQPVSNLVNSPANDDPRVLEPAAEAPEPRGTLPLFGRR